MKLIMIHGGNQNTPKLCKRAGWDYGAKFGSIAYQSPVMMDFAEGDFSKYLEQLAIHRPTMALACDWLKPELESLYSERVGQIAELGIMPIVAAKHERALTRFDASVRIGVSVPTGYMNDGWIPPRELFSNSLGKHLHLLGGHPDQWKWLVNYYGESGVTVLSIDGNAHYQQAYEYGKFWSKWGYYREMRGKGYDTNALAICSMKNAKRYLVNNAPVHPSKRIEACKHQLGIHPKQPLLFAV